MGDFEKRTAVSLLLIDDDAELCAMMKEFFSESDFRLDCAYNGRDGLTRALEGAYDLIVLDVMLPGVNGFMLLQQLRKRKEVPVIMLTARINRHDRILGLDAGARRLPRETVRSRRTAGQDSGRAASCGPAGVWRRRDEIVR